MDSIAKNINEYLNDALKYDNVVCSCSNLDSFKYGVKEFVLKNNEDFDTFVQEETGFNVNVEDIYYDVAETFTEKYPVFTENLFMSNCDKSIRDWVEIQVPGTVSFWNSDSYGCFDNFIENCKLAVDNYKDLAFSLEDFKTTGCRMVIRNTVVNDFFDNGKIQFVSKANELKFKTWVEAATEGYMEKNPKIIEKLYNQYCDYCKNKETGKDIERE